MNPEERRMLEETRELVEENTVILRRIQRSQRMGLAFRAIYWVAIIAATYGAYFLIQPYVDSLKGSLSTLGL
ncbi:hypothetical protein KW799_02470 [Candidatus Parcubacteria bacterium]|nr:hypothetical protein [Candidatus Parcubacteria bacterium]